MQFLRSFGLAAIRRLAAAGSCDEAKLRAMGAVAAYLAAYLAACLAVNVVGM